MKTLARRILCGTALLAAVVPAFAAQIQGGHLRAYPRQARGPDPMIADHAIPFGSGFGSGTWRLPATGGAGTVSAALFDPSGRLRYVVRANLLPSGELPPEGAPQGGMFYGELLAVEGPGLREPIAVVEGTWVLQPSGTGLFAASILVPTENPVNPFLAIGMIEGTLHGPMGMSQLQHIGGGGYHAATTLGRLSLNWSVGD